MSINFAIYIYTEHYEDIKTTRYRLFSRLTASYSSERQYTPPPLKKSQVGPLASRPNQVCTHYSFFPFFLFFPLFSPVFMVFLVFFICWFCFVVLCVFWCWFGVYVVVFLGGFCGVLVLCLVYRKVYIWVF